MNLLHAFYFIYEEKCSETLKTHTENADQSAWEQKKSRTQTHKWVCKAELLAIEPNGIRATKRVCIWQLFFHGSLFAFPSYNKHTFSFSCHFFYLLISFHFIWTFFFCRHGIMKWFFSNVPRQKHKYLETTQSPISSNSVLASAVVWINK